MPSSKMPPPSYHASVPAALTPVHPDVERQETLPPRPSPKDRRCPRARSCSPGLTIASYSLNTHGDNELLLRRVCMITLLSIRTAVNVAVIMKDSWSIKIWSTVLGVLGFCFVAYCLHLIGSMIGERKVFGRYFGKWHFDAFLFGAAVLHVGLLVAACFGWNRWVINGIWTALGFAIWGVAWVALWQPESRGV